MLFWKIFNLSNCINYVQKFFDLDFYILHQLKDRPRAFKNLTFILSNGMKDASYVQMLTFVLKQQYLTAVYIVD